MFKKIFKYYSVCFFIELIFVLFFIIKTGAVIEGFNNCNSWLLKIFPNLIVALLKGIIACFLPVSLFLCFGWFMEEDNEI